MIVMTWNVLDVLRYLVDLGTDGLSQVVIHGVARFRERDPEVLRDGAGQGVVHSNDEPLGQLAHRALRDVQAGAGGHTQVQVGRVQPRVSMKTLVIISWDFTFYITVVIVHCIMHNLPDEGVPCLLVTRGPGHVQPQGVILGHVLLLGPGDGVVVLHQPHHPVQVKLAGHALLSYIARQEMISRFSYQRGKLWLD